MIDSMKNKIDK